MEDRRWINQSQPQTLVIAVYLLYIDAAFDLLLGGYMHPVMRILIPAISIAAGFGIANERKWGYGLGVGVAVFNLAFLLLLLGGNILAGGVSIIFAVAKLALLLHPQSHEYQKIWFK